jgi:hypothetical protein
MLTCGFEDISNNYYFSHLFLLKTAQKTTIKNADQGSFISSKISRGSYLNPEVSIFVKYLDYIS